MNRQEERREKERRWEMVELKDGQQQEMEGKLPVHSHLMSMDRWKRIRIFESLHLEGSYVGD